ncbi:hypothetical protein COUCH_21755 [Couchioplanes caeruleus]|uniref:LysM peptidoglycan-binding domain-containing protein n=1 Tax=Couchioplanes caeruleus TaxID=56438 RepID=UPI0020C0CF2D|nr:hypothetical protein [Couchioplanes caeruleus]UQU61671.1 hypothetical protein COUCH_21755 [Couchioplanes caeruleus]
MRARIVLMALLAALAGAAPHAPGPVAAAPVAAYAVLAEPTDPVKWYRVRPSFNGQDEFLYEIAERFLGDGDRNSEIFALNKGRLQPDGKRLTVPDEIEPGWILRLPPDAQGPGVEFSALPTASPSPPAPSATSSSSPVAAAADTAFSWLPVVLILGVLLALAGAALLLLLLRRRRSAPAAAAALGIPRQRTGPPAHLFDTAASWTVDRALRVLTTAAGAGVPAIYGVSVDEAWLKLRLVVPHEPAPAPWTAQDGGRLWVAALRDLQVLPVDPAAAALCPRLVTLGSLYGTRELLDLGQAPGVIALQGDPGATAALAAAWATELTTSPWSPGVRVVAGGLSHHVAPGVQVTSAQTVDEAIAAAEAQPPGAGVLLLGSAPPAHDLPRIGELAARGDAAWAVVVLGATSEDRWRFRLQADGRLDTGSLGVMVYAPGASAPA